MKTRILGAVLGIAALSGLLVPSSAQAAADGVSSARLNGWGKHGGGSVRANVDFVNRKKVIFRNFTVRDLCPGDNAPVRARVVWIHTDGTTGHSAWRKDTNGCGDHGTNFGTIIRTDTKPIKKVYLHLQVYARSGGIRGFAFSADRYNQYT
ncbi:hypothetical protein AB0C27_20380 [Nonomuraea sp. NPDC048882]|uniref:hypothetical protein n=1 Tax=Nonomuraea sp. NPDC048882 TaxID=3154347 RepID=UPI0033EB3960